MASEIRVDKITSLSGVGTISPSPTGVEIAGITTVGILTSTGAITSGAGFKGNRLNIVSETPRIYLTDTNNNDDYQVRNENGTFEVRNDTDGVNVFTIEKGPANTATFSNTTKVGSGVTLSSDGHSFVAGVSTTGTLSVSGIVTSTGDVDPTTGTITSSGDITVGGDLTLESVTPAIKLTDSDQEADNKTFMISGSSTKKLRIQALTDAGGGGGNVFEFLRDGNNVYQFQGAKSAVPWFAVNNNTRRVGIGTTIPAKALEVTSNTVPQLQVGMSNDSDRASLMHNGSHLYFDTTSGDQVFRTGSSSEKLRILSTGGITFNGDTATANALDDYEEGDWTPKQTDGGTNYTISHAKYVKIGRLVHLTFDITSSSATNLTQIWNLPFTPSNYSTWHLAYYAINGNTTNTGTSGYVAGRHGGLVVTSGGGYLHTRITGGTVTWNITNTDRMIGSASYETTA